MNVLFSFVQYVLIAVVLTGCILGGVTGTKILRRKKDLKNQQEAE